MKALIFDEKLRLATDYPQPAPPSGESLVRVTLAGICNTDIEIARGYMGYRGILGHEFVGVVEESDDESLIGQRVVGEINAHCGECAYCRRGMTTHCPHRTTLGIAGRDGALAEYLTLPTRNLHRVPDNIPDEVAAFTEPLAAACEILEQIQICPTDRVIVLGDGKLGLLVAQVVSLTGCDLTTIGHHRDKLDILERRGIDTQIGSVADMPREVDIVIECTGNASGFVAARRMLRPRGTLVLKSTYHGTPEVDLSSVVVDEITLIGSRCGPFAPALRLLSRDLVDVQSLITATYGIDDALAAFEHAQTKGTLKILIAI